MYFCFMICKFFLLQIFSSFSWYFHLPRFFSSQPVLYNIFENQIWEKNFVYKKWQTFPLVTIIFTKEISFGWYTLKRHLVAKFQKVTRKFTNEFFSLKVSENKFLKCSILLVLYGYFSLLQTFGYVWRTNYDVIKRLKCDSQTQ